MFSATYWKQVVERAVKAAAAALSAAWFAGDVVMNAFTLDWQEGLGIALAGAVASVLLSLASTPVGEPGSPSAVKIDQPVGSPR